MDEIVSGDEVIGSIWGRLKKAAKKVGSAGKAVGKGAYRAGKAGYKAGKKVGKYGYKVANKAAKVASPYLPAAAAAVTAVKLVRAARKGNPSAKKRIVRMRQAADAGDVEAQKAVGVVQAVAPLPQAQENYEPKPQEEQAAQEAQEEYAEECEGYECESEEEEAPADEDVEYDEEPADGSVAGWLFNKGYRNNVQAAELDKKNPFHAMRALYAAGMGKGTGTLKDGIDLGKKLLGL